MVVAPAAAAGPNATADGAIDGVTAAVTDTALWTDDAQAITFSHDLPAGTNASVAVVGEAETPVRSTGAGQTTVEVGSWVRGIEYPFEVQVTVGNESCTATIRDSRDTVALCGTDGGTGADFDAAPTAEVGHEALWNGPKMVTIGYDAPAGTQVHVSADNERVSTVSQGNGAVTLRVGSWFWGAGYPLNVSASTPRETCKGTFQQGTERLTLSCAGEPGEPSDPPNFQVSDVRASSPVTSGAMVNVSANVTNTGDLTGTQIVELSVDGALVMQRSVTLAGGEERSVSFSWAAPRCILREHTATVRSTNDSASATLADRPTLQSMALSLADSTLATNQSTRATVTFPCADGTTIDLTSEATLASSDASVASVSGSTVTANGAGSATIVAEYKGVSDSATIEVDPRLESIDLDLPSTMVVGETANANVTATYADGSTRNVTDDVQYATDWAYVRAVGREVTALEPGVGYIGAVYEEHGIRAVDKAEITVEQIGDGPLVNLSVPETTMTRGESQQVTVTARLSDGSVRDVTDQVQFNSSNSSVLAVEDGEITAKAPGEAEIGAYYEEAGLQGADRVKITVEPKGDGPPRFRAVAADGFLQIGSGADGGNEKDRYVLPECPGGTPAHTYHNSSDCVRFNGTIDVERGTFTAPAEEVSFPTLEMYSHALDQTIDVNYSVPYGFDGTIDFETGRMTLNGTLAVNIAPNEFGATCGFSVPFTATTGTSGDASSNIGQFNGTALSLDTSTDPHTGTVSQVAAEFAVPAATGCDIFNDAVNGSVDLPSPAGENVAVLEWDVTLVE